MASTKIYHFYNRYHLGDNLLNIKFFYNITQILRDNNIVIHYYYDNTYPHNTLKELNCYIDPHTVILKPLSERPHNADELWMGKSINNITHDHCDAYYNLFYKNILTIMSLDNLNIDTSLWQNEPYLLPIYDSLDIKYKNIDILIINNTGNSGQYNDNSKLNNLARYLNTKFNILVTTFIDDSIPHTRDLTVQQYGAISTHSTYVISVWSGACVGMYNNYSKDYVKKWFFVFNDGNVFHDDVNAVGVSATNINMIKLFFDSL